MNSLDGVMPIENLQLSKKISLFKGDITRLEVDAIVNAANSRLRAGGGGIVIFFYKLPIEEIIDINYFVLNIVSS